MRRALARVWTIVATAVLVGYAQECRTRKRLRRAAMLRRMSKPFAALYAGKCADCAELFKPGTAIRYDNLGQIVHAECEGNIESDPLATNAPVCERCWMTKPCDCEEDG